MNSKIKQAKNLHERSHDLYDKATEIINPTLTETEEEEYIEEAQKLWAQHAELLSEVYPSPSLRHHIQATITDIYWWDNGNQGTIILKTSFPTLSQFKEAEEELGWNYSLDSLQVGQCETCNEYYLTENGYTAYKSGFCSKECLNEDELLRQIEGEDWEAQYAERIVDSDPYDQDTVFF